MIFPNYLIALMIVLIGFLPFLFMNPLANIVSIFVSDTQAIQHLIPTLNSISISLGIFIIIIGVIWFLRTWQQRGQDIKKNAIWACAHTGAKPALHQYTATSYADNFGMIAKQIVQVKKEFEEFEEDEIFPKKRQFETHSRDVFETYLITKPSNILVAFLNKIAVFQTGKIQHYLLYALVFVVVIFILTLLNWI